MNAEIIAVGTELLLGQIVNTNAQYISERLSQAGVSVFFETVVGDNPARLTSALSLAMSRADILIITGGLGPTADDLTKETAAELCGKKLVLHQPSLDAIKGFFDSIGREMTQNNVKQAMMPEGCIILKNDYGTAPGCIIEKDNKYIVLMPGPPREMKPMFDEQVFPFLKNLCGKGIYSRVLRIFGIGESALEEQIRDLTQSTNPTVAPYAKEGEVTLRITANASSPDEAQKLIDGTELQIRNRIGNAVYAIGDDASMASAVGSLLLHKGKTIAVAESCTGGMIASMLTDVPGISSVFTEGVVTYANEAKERLGVSHETLLKYGAVSEQTAKEMAQSVRLRAGADIGISTTGIAGPGGGTPEKPVGLVYIGFSAKDKTYAVRLNLIGERNRIRRSAALNALNTVRVNL